MERKIEGEGLPAGDGEATARTPKDPRRRAGRKFLFEGEDEEKNAPVRSVPVSEITSSPSHSEITSTTTIISQENEMTTTTTDSVLMPPPSTPPPKDDAEEREEQRRPQQR